MKKKIWFFADDIRYVQNQPRNDSLYCLFDVLHAGGYILVMLCTEKLFGQCSSACCRLAVVRRHLRPLLFLIDGNSIF